MSSVPERRGGRASRLTNRIKTTEGKKSSCEKDRVSVPPLYAKKPHIIEAHGDKRVDEYYYLQKREAPVVKKYLKQENEWVENFFSTTAKTEDTGSLRRKLFKEMKSRQKPHDASLPSVHRNYWYYTRQVENAEYPLFCRRPYRQEDPENAFFDQEAAHLFQQNPAGTLPFYEDEVIFLDVNLFAQEHKLDFIDVEDVEISPDENKVAVMVDCSNGKEVFTCFIIQIEESKNYSLWLEHSASSVERNWATQMEASGRSKYMELNPKNASSQWSNASGSKPSSPTVAMGSPKSAKKECFLKTKTTRVKSSPTVIKPRPSHTLLYRFDLFDMSSEIFWLSNTAVLYFSLDSKMRPFQLIYHNLELENSGSSSVDPTVICYEEEDERFWLGALTFTTDEEFVLFSSSSTDISECFVMPTAFFGQWETLSPAERRERKQRPILHSIPLISPLPHSGLPPPQDEALPHSDTPRTPMLRFLTRTAEPHCRDYDVDHHPCLLGGKDVAVGNRSCGGGAWIVTTDYWSASPEKLENSSVFVVPCEGIDYSVFHSKTPPAALLSSDRCLVPLFAYDPLIKVEGVELMEKCLLISVRKNGSPTSLFCPVEWVTQWWQEGDGRKPLSLHTLLNLSSVLSALEGVSDKDKWLPKTVPVHASDDSSPSIKEEKDKKNTDKEWQRIKQFFEHHYHPSPKITPLPFVVECYSDSRGFAGNHKFSMVVSHLIKPSLVYHVQFLPDTHELELRLLREEYVPTTEQFPFPELDYYGVTLWVPSDFAFQTQNGSPYTLERIPTAEEPDTVLLPVQVCWRKDRLVLPDDTVLSSTATPPRPNPFVVHVYGGYGDASDEAFSSVRLCILDRGFVWASAAVRGGGEFGIPWRDAGRRLQRPTTVNDFVSVCAFLQNYPVALHGKKGFCALNSLISCGGSAGGMVVGRALNMAPFLFRAVIGQVPFVDCLTSLLDSSLPLTSSDWEEFGNPVESPEAYYCIKSISPMDTIPKDWDCFQLKIENGVSIGGRRPHVFMESAWDDSRVGYWEPMKFTAKLRDLDERLPPSIPPRVLLHYCDFGSGHGGVTGRFEQLHEIAREYAFMICISSCQYD